MPMGDNGTSSEERSMPEALSNAAARFVDSLKINSISEAVRRGRRVVIKRRHGYSEQLTGLANLYFRIAGLPIRFWTKKEDWQRWELNCFKMLNGDRFRASRVCNNAICIDHLPGENLWEHLNRQTLNRRMVEAAGLEFRRTAELAGLFSFFGSAMLGRETKLGTRLECLAGVSHRTGASSKVEFPDQVSSPSTFNTRNFIRPNSQSTNARRCKIVSRISFARSQLIRASDSNSALSVCEPWVRIPHSPVPR